MALEANSFRALETLAPFAIVFLIKVSPFYATKALSFFPRNGIEGFLFPPPASSMKALMRL